MRSGATRLARAIGTNGPAGRPGTLGHELGGGGLVPGADDRMVQLDTHRCTAFGSWAGGFWGRAEVDAGQLPATASGCHRGPAASRCRSPLRCSSPETGPPATARPAGWPCSPGGPVSLASTTRHWRGEQSVQIWAARVLIGIEPTFTQIGGYVRDSWPLGFWPADAPLATPLPVAGRAPRDGT
jgi:hypothetical protein